ncbi:MAG: DM13 domain-containing protein [Gemmatimonadales bacterium]
MNPMNRMLPAIAAAALLAPVAVSAQTMDKMGKMDKMEHGEMMSHEMGMAVMGAGSHAAAGHVMMVHEKDRHMLRFSKDFKVDKAADLYVALSRSAMMTPGNSMTVRKLSSAHGAQEIKLPAGTDPSAYTHVVIFSRRTGMTVATAALGADGMDKMDKMDKMEKGMDKMEKKMDKMEKGMDKMEPRKS